MSGGDFKFTAVTDIDPNVWYTLSEERVDKYTNKEWTSSLQIRDRDTGELAVWPRNNHAWQFQPIDAKKGRYSLRCSETGIFKQLSVCYRPDEVANGKTQPCLADSHGGDEQIWEVSDWGLEGNSTLRFINMKNGTDYWMDVHKGNPMFMSSNIDTQIYQPAQRWLMKSASLVNDGDFSTRFTNLPTTATSAASTTTEPPSTTTRASSDSITTGDPTSTGSAAGNSANPDSGSTSSGGGGTSVGLAAGVGVGVGVAVIALGIALFFWWRRRQRRAGVQPTSPEMAHTPYTTSSGPYAASSAPYTAQSNNPPAWSGQHAGHQYPQEYYAKVPTDPQELEDTRNNTHELPAKGHSHELN